jgi:hypothetical protein
MALAFFLRVSAALGLHPHELVERLARERALEPVQELGRRIDLIVVLSFRKHRQLVEVLVESRRRLGDADETMLDHCGLRVQAHDLLAGRLVAGDAVAAVVDQLLDQLGAGRLVLDQHNIRSEQAVLFAHRALERRILEPPA